MPMVSIDGVEIEARQGATVLQTALEHGIHIPHFCYHPRLRVAGNCRMCLVEIEKVPKLQIACGTEVRDGMAVSTKSEKVVAARQAVLEFLLINHPLDCPTCDQCGECKLQDYCFEYGQEKSRFVEEKRRDQPLNIGPNLVQNPDRCLHCTRCIRFLRDIAGSEEFALSERGHHSMVGPYLDKAVESPFSMNLTEICPVGALTSRHFRFKGRSWLMQKTRTLCPGCSRGCNVFAWASQGEVLRLTPAINNEVNLAWMCDPGRLTIEPVHSADRPLRAMRRGDPVNRDAVIEEAAIKLQALEGDAIGVIGSPHLSNEDLYAIRKLAREVLGVRHLGLIPGAEDQRAFGPSGRPLKEWFIRDDKTPNTRGARDILLSTETDLDVNGMIGAAASGRIKALLVFCEDLVSSLEGSGQVSEALQKLDFLLVCDSQRSSTTDLADLMLPEASFAEKDGTFTNKPGRVQRLRSAVSPMGESRSAWQTCQDLAVCLGANWRFGSAASVMDEIAAKLPGYQNLSYSNLPDEGKMLELEPEEGKSDA